MKDNNGTHMYVVWTTSVEAWNMIRYLSREIITWNNRHFLPVLVKYMLDICCSDSYIPDTILLMPWTHGTPLFFNTPNWSGRLAWYIYVYHSIKYMYWSKVTWWYCIRNQPRNANTIIRHDKRTSVNSRLRVLRDHKSGGGVNLMHFFNVVCVLDDFLGGDLGF